MYLIKKLLCDYRPCSYKRLIAYYCKIQNIIRNRMKLDRARVKELEILLAMQEIKTNQLSGKIRNLEEQHDIMHNFLVEINKYLVKFADQKND
jgi:uncharacterized coiled-coil protein SlyX